MRSDTDPDVVRVVTVWKSSDHLDEMLRLTPVPFARQLFMDIGADPEVSVSEVLERS